jgi:glycosyltransferase involved in cell wall biosynthesis
MSTSRPNPTVCLLASTLVTGGAERVVLGLGSGLGEHGIRSIVVTLYEAGPVGEELEGLGVEVIPGAAAFKHDPWSSLRLARIMKRESVDILFCLDHHNAIFWGSLASRMAGVGRKVLSVHSTGLWGRKSSFTLSDRMVLPLYDRVVALARSHADHLEKREGIPGDKIVVIHNGVDTGRFVPIGSQTDRERLRSELEIPESAIVVTIVAALRPEKNHEMLLRAAAELSGNGYLFLVVGEGKEETRLKDLAGQLSLVNEVRFLGRRNDIPDILSASDIFVLCSHPVVETFPLSVLEAMSSGLPVISTRVGSIETILDEGTDGLLVEPGDEKALVRAIAALGGDETRRRGFGEMARSKVVERFSLKDMVARYADLFREILEV